MKQNRYEIFREVTERICGDLNIETALMNCAAFLMKVMPVDYMYMMIFDDNWPAIRPLAMISNREELPIQQTDFIPISRSEGNWNNKTFLIKKAIILNQAGSIPVVKRVFSTFGLPEKISCMHMRTTISGRYTGSVGIIAQGEDRYLSDHAEVLEELHKPFAIALINSSHYQETLRLKEQMQYDQKALFTDINALVGDEVIGARGGLSAVMDLVNRVAALESPVLLFGETGTGKEIMARYIHNQSSRCEGPFIKVDCGAIQENLVEDELFGHEKGSFTGAITEHRGRFERARDGTIFLDEIGELHPTVQLKLLRVLQDKEFERVGGSQVINTNARVIAATHRNLEGMVRNREFREDLWYRLNVFPVFIPPLRERKQDISDLAHYFVQRKVKEMNLVDVPTLGHGAIDQLLAYEWPGNVREFQNVIERAIILSSGRPLRFPSLSTFSHELGNTITRIHDTKAFPSLNDIIKDHVIHALNISGGKVGGKDGAAQLLDIQPGTLRARMRKLGIPFGRHVKPEEYKKV